MMHHRRNSMPTLPAELQPVVDAGVDSPPRLIDARTNTEYVLLRADAYDRVRSLVEVLSLTKSEQAALLRRAGNRAGWDDPEMAVYDNFRVQ
jgi:hypothetical protein